MPGWAPLLLLSLCLPSWLALPPPVVTFQSCANSSVNLPPPINLTRTMRGIGFINYTWSWKPPSDLENSTKHIFAYESSIRYDGGKWEQRKLNPNLYRGEFLKLNMSITFRVKALVNTLPCRESNWVDISISSEEGGKNTAVRNFTCVYYNFEYINCTWIIGSMAPRDTIYSFHYWQESMHTIQNCISYILKDIGRVGCQLQRDKFNDTFNLYSKVVGVSATAKIKPVYHVLDSSSFVKLRRPWGINVTRLRVGFHVTWEIPVNWKTHCLIYQARIKSSKTDFWVSYNFSQKGGEIMDADTRSKNTIQVRVKYNNHCGSAGIWSEWSPEAYFGEDAREGWSWSIVLLIFIPILVATSAIIFFTKLKKLQKLILPPIPDPGKLLKGMFGDSNGDYSMRVMMPFLIDSDMLPARSISVYTSSRSGPIPSHSSKYNSTDKE